ncbi:MAG: XdhC family protein [Bradymonadaceae bacterium]
MSFWRQLHDKLELGEPVFLCLVAHNTTHSPGTRGAKMFVEPDGSITGTIGGGGMEADVIDLGVEVLEEGEFEPDYQTLVHRKEGVDEEEQSGLICAGKQTHVYYLCRPGRDLEVLAEVVRRNEADESGLLVLDEDGIRLESEDHIDPQTPPVRLREDGEDWQYEEQIVEWKRAAVLGGGHVGAAVCRQLDLLGYAIENFDVRDDVFTFRQNEWADHKHVVDDYADCGELIRYPGLTHVIVVTSDYPSDVRALLGVVEREADFPYIGAMGSPAKLHAIADDLRDHGVSDQTVDDFHAPIGLEMTSNKPAEIAVSIASELLRLREELFPHAKPPEPADL